MAVEKATGKTPKTLLDKPRLHEWLSWYYDAFWMINSGRRIHQGSVGMVPLTEMVAYLELYAVEEIEARQLFVKTMRALDSVYVKQVNAKIQQKIEAERRAAEAERVRHGR